MNQEVTLTLKQIMIIWFIGFTTGVPFMSLILSIKYHSSFIIPIVNFVVMTAVSIYGFIVFRKKDNKQN